MALRKDKADVEHKGQYRDEAKLNGRERAQPRRQRVVRQHHGQNGQSQQNRQQSAGTLTFDVLIPMAPPPKHQTGADDTGADNHDSREDRLTRQCRVCVAMLHHRENDRNLDGGDDKRQHQSAVGLTDTMGDGLGVMQRREHSEHHKNDGERIDRKQETKRAGDRQRMRVQKHREQEAGNGHIVRHDP